MAFCTQCGKEVQDDAKFCESCGAATEAATEAPAVNNVAGRVPDLNEDWQVENLSLFGYFIKCLKNFAVFKGRARRKEYWGFYLFSYIFYFVSAIIMAFFSSLISDSDESVSVMVILYVLIVLALLLIQLALLIPLLAVCVRRLHDLGHSGKALLWCLTIIGALPIGIWISFWGSEGTNKYGPNPHGEEL
jgi:uncharacterized membrane protein YhaH (DUF805 family)